MHYIDRLKFIKIFNQTKRKRKTDVKQIANKCNLSLLEIKTLISPHSNEQRISLPLVEEIGFGFGMNQSEIQYWVMKMGTVYSKPQAKKTATPNKSHLRQRLFSKHYRHSQKTHFRIRGPHKREHKKSLNTKSNYYTKSHSWFYIITLGVMIILLMVGGSCLSIYHHHKRNEEEIERLLQRNNEANGGYNSQSLQKQSNQATVKKLVAINQHKDHHFISSITYNDRTNVATIHLTKSNADKINEAANSHKKNSKSKIAIKTGIKIDNRLTNQAIQIANRSHDGYFTFSFANAKNYEAPNTAARK